MFDLYMKRKFRLSENAAIGGVCGGIAEYFDSDPVLVRLLFCMLFAMSPLLTFFGYMILGACMNEY